MEAVEVMKQADFLNNISQLFYRGTLASETIDCHYIRIVPLPVARAESLLVYYSDNSNTSVWVVVEVKL
jgi:hypothetical protein